MSERVLLTRRMPSDAAEVLTAAGHTVDMFDTSEPPPRAELIARARGCAGVITMLSDPVDAEFLDAVGASLRIVANYAVGFDNIDLEACRKRNIRVSNTPGVLTEATADLAWALILAAARNVADRLAFACVSFTPTRAPTRRSKKSSAPGGSTWIGWSPNPTSSRCTSR